ncbi:Na(+) H(+) antiporter subunit F [hydrothermal vent metagenome]|uniref:Na(+) H(+) antiporter subunit F n=1 Tax=hydrothermal vent metagenome TaxID=652676 RepID=A0A1W1CPU5_9ZZZZ
MINLLILLTLFAIFLSFIRFIKGPHLTDRVVAFDTMGIIAVSLLVLLSVRVKSTLYLDVAFVFALIGFIGTIIFARFNVTKDIDA